MGLTVEGFDSVSLSPLPNANEGVEELGKIAATEACIVDAAMFGFWVISSTNAEGVDVGEKVCEEDVYCEELYVEAIAALAMAW
jgi:hypothetical protein